MKTQTNYRTPILLLFMLLIVGLRIVAPLSPDFKLIANFTGLGAITLLGGAYFKNSISAFLIPVLMLLLSDLGLMAVMGSDYAFYEGWYYTYIAFVLMVLVAKLIINKVNVPLVFGAGLVAVLIHWIVTDYAYFLVQTKYPYTLMGFWAVLVDAIPFELNFLYGTLGYSALLFGLFEALKAKYPALNLKSATV